ncbi:hypothetical protein H9P43_006690 [Blastocladiella emersonii ATCC 22665]|nr:hypothetical protein H9P43_006690 [Blastocladiella emersonii ATCC 22665]
MGPVYKATRSYFLLSSLYSTMSVLAPPRAPGAPQQSPPTPQELRSHLIFWVTVVCLGASERVADRLLRLMPLYDSAKFLVLALLMLTKHMGTYVLFTHRLRPWFRKYQKVIELWITVYPQRALARALAAVTQAYAQYRALSAMPHMAADADEDDVDGDDAESRADREAWAAATSATLPTTATGTAAAGPTPSWSRGSSSRRRTAERTGSSRSGTAAAGGNEFGADMD